MLYETHLQWSELYGRNRGAYGERWGRNSAPTCPWGTGGNAHGPSKHGGTAFTSPCHLCEERPQSTGGPVLGSGAGGFPRADGGGAPRLNPDGGTESAAGSPAEGPLCLSRGDASLSVGGKGRKRGDGQV